MPTETMSAERAAYLRRAVDAIARALLAQMARELAAPSTDSASLADRAMLRMLTPWVPKLQAVLLSKLSETDPASLERIAGATADAIESVIAQAPGDPLPRYRMTWDADGALVLVPIDGGEVGG